jgi:hypothetical protein
VDGEAIKTLQRTEIDTWFWTVLEKQHRTALKTLHRVLRTAGAAIQTLHTMTETLLMKEIDSL